MSNQVTKKLTTRELALDTLIKVFKNKSYSNIQLNKALKSSDLDERDRHLVTQIVYGTIQYKIFLEYQIKDLIPSKIKDSYLKPLILMSVYQLIFLDKVPAHAIINEANEIAKNKSRGGAFKLVNAILRQVSRQDIQLPTKENPVEYLSVKESMPTWLVDYLINNFGLTKTKAVLHSFNQVPHNSLRVNQRLTSPKEVEGLLEDLGYEVEVSKLTNHNLIVDHGGIPKTKIFENGLVTIQDEAASLVVDTLNIQPTDFVLDGCAAPGGKTIQIAEQLIEGQVVALDIHAKKLDLILENAKRMKVSDKIKVKELDARKSSTYFSEQKFDKILIDAPCSGLGLLRRKPEIRYDKTFNDVQNLAKIQLDILRAVANLLKPDGRLVYSTCTITIEENEMVISKFLEEFPQFEIEEIKVGNLIGNNHGLRIFPDEYQSDGFYITSLRLRG